MSTNISRQKRDDLLKKIEEIRAFIQKSENDSNSINLLQYINELIKEVNGKKYGLVFEEHREKIDEILNENIPVLAEEKDLFIDNGGETNFLIEGDNLASLSLLEKTHKGKIDVIYIDPPYNTGNSFIYDDKIVDEDDEYKHSKYASFIYERLMFAKRLLSSKGLIFISIDDKEQSVTRLLCDEVFGETRFLTTIGWEKRTKCQNTKTARKMLQPKIEYILVYRNSDNRTEFNCHIIGEKQYSNVDDKGIYRLEEVGQMGASGIRGRGSMIFPILGILPRDGNQWKLGINTILDFEKRNDLIQENDKVYRKIRPFDESVDMIKPFWAFFNAEQFGTAESAKSELSTILGTKKHNFETVKPVVLIKEIIFQSTHKKSIILDFFAGSGTTGESVLELNKEDGGHRKFILCTNNENNICKEITYARIKNVLTKDNLPGSLKYFRVDFVPITEKEYYEYADKLLLHVRELVELENAINFNGNKKIAIILTDNELQEFCSSITDESEYKTIYVGHDLLLDKNQKAFFKSKKIQIKIIPEYYYPELNG